MRKQHSKPGDAFNLEQDETGILHSPAGEKYPPAPTFDLDSILSDKNLIMIQDRDGNSKFLDITPRDHEGNKLDVGRPDEMKKSSGRPDPLNNGQVKKGSVSFDEEEAPGQEDIDNLLNFLDKEPDALEDVLNDFVTNDEKIPDEVFEMFPNAHEIVQGIEQDLEDIATGRPVKYRAKTFTPKTFKPRKFEPKPLEGLNEEMINERKKTRGF